MGKYAHLPSGCHRLKCQLVHVYAHLELSVLMPSGTGREESVLALKKTQQIYMKTLPVLE